LSADRPRDTTALERTGQGTARDWARDAMGRRSEWIRPPFLRARRRSFTSSAYRPGDIATLARTGQEAAADRPGERNWAAAGHGAPWITNFGGRWRGRRLVEEPLQRCGAQSQWSTILWHCGGEPSREWSSWIRLEASRQGNTLVGLLGWCRSPRTLRPNDWIS
jgi:hypothetical protein